MMIPKGIKTWYHKKQLYGLHGRLLCDQAAEPERMRNDSVKTVTYVVLAVLAVTNLVSFFLMRHDKRCAQENRRRIPEKTLFLSAFLFGAFGGTLGMFVFRHKTKHWYFKVFFPLMLVLQAGILGYLWARGIL